MVGSVVSRSSPPDQRDAVSDHRRRPGIAFQNLDKAYRGAAHVGLPIPMPQSGMPWQVLHPVGRT